MKKILFLLTMAFSACLIVLLYACNSKPPEIATGGRETVLLFPRGDQDNSNNFHGEVWVKQLVDADSLNQTAVGNVTFSPGARSKWHLHPGGQILLVTDGVGYYQEKGQPKIILRKGDIIKCPPNTPHWHGASADTAFVQLAITGREKGATVWLDDVTGEEYDSKHEISVR